MTKITDKLDEINCTLEKILLVMNKPVNRFIRALEITGMVAGIYGIIGAIDLIKNWL